jgi:hypothetical protein
MAMANRKYILVADSLPGPIQNLISIRLQSLGTQWAHYMSSVWLFSDPEDRASGWWAQLLGPSIGQYRFIILEVNVRAWWIRAPERFTDWVRNVWLG